MPNINFFDNYVMNSIVEEIVPTPTFFRDRYFQTGAGDIFKADKVLTEYKKGDRKMAAFVADMVGDIPVERTGYEISEYTPAKIAPSRILTIDELKKRGFGEALYPGLDQAQRAARIQLQDFTDLDKRITRREEWLAVQTMLNNGCTIQEMVDGKTNGNQKIVQFYNQSSDHTYTISSANKWNTANGDFFGDVKNMCRMLSKRGLPAVDLVLGTDATDCILNIEKVQKLLDRNSGIIVGTIEAELSQYEGVSYLGTLNFGGFRLNVICADSTYVDANGSEQKYFPANAAMVTAPGCGHMMYGQVTQIDYGKTDFATYAAKRVPKLVVDQDKDIRKLRLVARPLAAPHAYCPYIVATGVC